MQAYGSTLDGVRTIVRQEGVMALWRGTSASLLMVRACLWSAYQEYVCYATPCRTLGATSSLCIGFLAKYRSGFTVLIKMPGFKSDFPAAVQLGMLAHPRRRPSPVAPNTCHAMNARGRLTRRRCRWWASTSRCTTP